jgi:hypothetical protein
VYEAVANEQAAKRLHGKSNAIDVVHESDVQTQLSGRWHRTGALALPLHSPDEADRLSYGAQEILEEIARVFIVGRS